ncbi:MAG: 50S ribosomal protein L3 N(5)-glutamine methyltransferase, partial [Usitatibacteraceae bacterium]
MPSSNKGTYDLARRELVTVRDLVRFAVTLFNEEKIFFGHGSANAFDEAAYLVLHALHLPLDKLEPFFDARLTSPERDAVVDMIERRVRERIPLAYLTNEAWLGEYKFYVDQRAIVPRSYIAELLRDELSPWVAEPEGVESALDLCTGSGCLAILAALTFPHAVVDAVDLSADALEVARRNVDDYSLADRVELIRSNMFEELDDRRYDLIISNPPYVTAKSMAALPQEYLREPGMALASGIDGLDHVRVILREAPNYLNPDGVLVVEVGFNREGVETAFPHIPFTWADTSAGDGVV